MATPLNVFLDGKINENVASAAVKEAKEFKLLVEEIKKHQPSFNVNELEVVLNYQADARTATDEGEAIVPISILELKNKENTVQITVFTHIGIGTSHTARVKTTDGEFSLRGFEVENSEVTEIFALNAEIGEPGGFEDLINNPNYVAGNTITAQAGDLLSGSWCMRYGYQGKDYRHCGPGCGDGKSSKHGGGTPINGIDTCCRAHDRCYGNFGYGDYCCDKQLVNCIALHKWDDITAYNYIKSYFGPRAKKC